MVSMSDTSVAAYVAEIEAWRAQREADLRSPDSWLSLTGLFVLSEGRHTVGSRTDNSILLPPGAPDVLGVIEFRQGKAQLTITTPAPLLVDGAPVEQIALVDNSSRQPPTLVTTGTVTFFVHRFGDQWAIRVKDSANPAIGAFPGCEWFPVDPAYRVRGQFVPYDTPRAISISTVRDTAATYQSVGKVVFQLAGQSRSLVVAGGGNPQQLSTILRDATAGQETYGAGRSLTIDKTAADQVVIDFNKAYNPPCAFSPYATCPLPPAENILPVAIVAGERYTPRLQAFYRAIAEGSPS
jgi:uncharacterized protein